MPERRRNRYDSGLTIVGHFVRTDLRDLSFSNECRLIMSQDEPSALDQFFASLDPDRKGEDLATDTANRELVAEGNRPCPICGTKMASEKREGVLIDVCVDHGVWLDKGELESVLLRSRSDAVKDAMRSAGQDRGFLLGYALGSSL